MLEKHPDFDPGTQFWRDLPNTADDCIEIGNTLLKAILDADSHINLNALLAFTKAWLIDRNNPQALAGITAAFNPDTTISTRSKSVRNPTGRWVIGILFLISITIVDFDLSYGIIRSLNTFLRLGSAIASALLVLLILIGIVSLLHKWPIFYFLAVFIENFSPIPIPIFTRSLVSVEGIEKEEPEISGCINALLVFYYITVTIAIFFILPHFVGFSSPVSPYPFLDHVALSIIFSLCITIFSSAFVYSYNYEPLRSIINFFNSV